MHHFEDNIPEQLPSGPHGSHDDSSLFDYLLIMVKHKKMILRTTFVAALLAIIVALLLPKIYTATTLILPGEDDNGIMGAMMGQMGGLSGITADAFGGKSKADLYTTMLKSETIKDVIIDRFKLMDVYEASNRTDAYVALNRVTKINVGKKDGVISISVSDKDPKRAAAIANAYVDELEKFATGLNMSGAGKNRAFLAKRIAETRADLSKAEDALKDFQGKNKAISVTDQAKVTIEGVAKLRAQLAAQEVQLATLQRQFTDSSQEVKTVKVSIANLRSQINGLEGKASASSSLPSVGSIPGLAQEYIRIMREFKIQEAVLEMLTKQYEFASLSETKDVSSVQVIQVAKVPERRSKPSRRNIVIVITFLGFFCSSCVAYGLERFRLMPDNDKQRWQNLIADLPFGPQILSKIFSA